MQDMYAEYSPYHYGFNNPMRFVDPTGLQAEETEEQKRAKVYELPEIVVVAPRPPEARVFMSFAYAGAIALRTPNPWIAGAGALILAGVATHEFLQPLLTKPYASEEAKEKPDEKKSQGEASVRNAAQDKRLSKGEIKKIKDAGYDIHRLKEGQKGLDIFKDTEGNLYLKPLNGQGPGEPLGININNL